MGKIEHERQRAHSQTSSLRSLKEKSKEKKPKLEITGFKDLATLVGPSSRKYKLSPNQRKVQLGVRVTIASLIAVGALVSYNFASSTPQKNNVKLESTIYSQDLDKETIMANAENELLNIIYQKRPSKKEKLLEQGFLGVTYPQDKGEDVDFIVVSAFEFGKSSEKFRHVKNNNWSNKKGKSSSLNDFLEEMIRVNHDKNPSQEKLQKLNRLTKEISQSTFKMDYDKIVDVSEKDLGEMEL